TLANGADRARRSPARSGPLLDAARASGSGVADAVQHDADYRHLRPALAGAAEPDRFLDRRAGSYRRAHDPGPGARLPRWSAAYRLEALPGSRRRLTQPPASPDGMVMPLACW